MSSLFISLGTSGRHVLGLGIAPVREASHVVPLRDERGEQLTCSHGLIMPSRSIPSKV